MVDSNSTPKHIVIILEDTKVSTRDHYLELLEEELRLLLATKDLKVVSVEEKVK